MSKIISFEQPNEATAGIDKDSKRLYVSVDGQPAQSFGACSVGLERMVLKNVGGEATCVYRTDAGISGHKSFAGKPETDQTKRSNKNECKRLPGVKNVIRSLAGVMVHQARLTG